MTDLIAKMKKSLYECAIPKYLELVRLSGKPDSIEVSPIWFLESWIDNSEELVKKLCADIDSINFNYHSKARAMVYPNGFLSLSMEASKNTSYPWRDSDDSERIEIFLATFEEFLNHEVNEEYVEILSDVVLERLNAYETRRNAMIKRIENLERFSFSVEREVITEKAQSIGEELINGIFQEEDENFYYCNCIGSDYYRRIQINKPGTIRIRNHSADTRQ